MHPWFDQRKKEGINVGLINARFIKPLDKDTILKRIQMSPWVVSVEENTLQAGFGFPHCVGYNLVWIFFSFKWFKTIRLG